MPVIFNIQSIFSRTSYFQNFISVKLLLTALNCVCDILISLYVYLYVCVYVYAYAYVYVYAYEYAYPCMYVCLFVWILPNNNSFLQK